MRESPARGPEPPCRRTPVPAHGADPRPEVLGPPPDERGESGGAHEAHRQPADPLQQAQHPLRDPLDPEPDPDAEFPEPRPRLHHEPPDAVEAGRLPGLEHFADGFDLLRGGGLLAGEFRRL